MRVLGEAEKDRFDRRVGRRVAMRGMHVEHAWRPKLTQMSQRGPSAREHVARRFAIVTGARYMQPHVGSIEARIAEETIRKIGVDDRRTCNSLDGLDCAFRNSDMSVSTGGRSLNPCTARKQVVVV